MKTMTVRNIPDEVAQWLATQADLKHTSVNQATVAVLSSAAFPSPVRKRRDLGGLFGSWTRDEARRFDARVQEAFGEVNSADWEDPR